MTETKDTPEPSHMERVQASADRMRRLFKEVPMSDAERLLPDPDYGLDPEPTCQCWKDAGRKRTVATCDCPVHYDPMVHPQGPPSPEGATDPWQRVDRVSSRTAKEYNPTLLVMHADDVDAALALERQQHRDALASLLRHCSNCGLTYAGHLNDPQGSAICFDSYGHVWQVDEPKADAEVRRLRDALAAQAQEIERLTLKRHDANCELRGPGGAVDRRCSCGFRALRAEMQGQAQEIADLRAHCDDWKKDALEHDREYWALQQELDQVRSRLTAVEQAAEMLWVVVANTSGGDWTQQTPEWQEAAARWRDNYFAALAPTSPQTPEDWT